MLFTAYAIVRTVPSANRPNRRKKKGLAEPRSASLAGFGFFHQHIRKGKVVITKTSKEKRLLLGSFLAPETDMIFGDGVGASPVRGPYCQLAGYFV